MTAKGGGKSRRLPVVRATNLFSCVTLLNHHGLPLSVTYSSQSSSSRRAMICAARMRSQNSELRIACSRSVARCFSRSRLRMSVGDDSTSLMSVSSAAHTSALSSAAEAVE